jgi:hypothetical protein
MNKIKKFNKNNNNYNYNNNYKQINNFNFKMNFLINQNYFLILPLIENKKKVKIKNQFILLNFSIQQ